MVRWDDGHEGLFFPGADAIVNIPNLVEPGRWCNLGLTRDEVLSPS